MHLMNCESTHPKSPLLIYHAVEAGESIRPVLNCVHKIMWRYIIPALAAVDEDNQPLIPDQVWRSVLWRLITILRQQAHGVKQYYYGVLQARNISNNEVVTNLLSSRRARLRPLARVSDEGDLSLRPRLIKQLKEAKIKFHEPSFSLHT